MKRPTKLNSVNPCPFNTDITCIESEKLKMYKEALDKHNLWNKVIAVRGLGGKYPLMTCCKDCVYAPKLKQCLTEDEEINIYIIEKILGEQK